mgnify:CR=1 FL=1
MSHKRPIIIDTDPGIDDAVAIAVALFDPTLEIKLITTVGGNVSLEKVTKNVLKLLKFFDITDIPVAAGAKEPLFRKVKDASSVHGESGMDGYDFEPGDEGLMLEENAVVAMRDTILKSAEKVTLIPIGPLTNIALLLKVFPEVKDNIEEIIMMGGSTGRGNFGVLTEFNAGIDPEAAKIVFKSGVKITMVGLDVGWKALVFPEDSLKIKEQNRTGEMIYSLFKHYRGKGLANGLKMYDGCAIAYLTEPEMFTVQECFIDVETEGQMTAGATLVDFRGYLGQENNAFVTTDIDDEAFREWLLAGLKRCP